MDTFQFKQIANVLQLLPTKAINYFSFTIFEKQQSIITYCNNQSGLIIVKIITMRIFIFRFKNIFFLPD